MKVCAVVAEFNPFHNGHAYLFREIRKAGYTHIVVIMSGNFVQRGEPAIFPKEIRAKNALQMGANLVIELPTVKVVATAEKYAFSALELIKNLGDVVDSVAFGMESENFGNLMKIKNALESESFQVHLRCYLEKGLNFASARQKALEEVMEDKNLADEIGRPNNILAVEYLKASQKLGLNEDFFAVKRMEDKDKYLSATKLRDMIIKNNPEYMKYIPKRVSLSEDLRADYFSSQKAVISRLRGLGRDEIALLPDISEGIENRIYESIKSSTSLEEILFSAKTKRYTLSRIKRIILCGFLGLTAEMARQKVPYLRILASDKKGFEIIKSVDFPIVSRYSDVSKFGKAADDFFEAENGFTNLYYLLTDKIMPCEKEKTFQLIRREDL